MTHKSRHDSWFRALLRLFPSEFRGDFGRQMAEVFRDQHNEASRHGRFGLPRLILRTVVDLVRSAPREHFDVFRRDAVHAARLLRRRPASTIAVVLSLAIGIGLNTALFSVVNGVLWRNLPFANSQELVRIVEVDAKSPERTAFATFGDFADLRDATHTFSSVAGIALQGQTIVEPGEPEEIRGMVVTEGFFETLGVRPILGRTFTPGDYEAAASININQVRPASQSAATSVIIISQALWERRFHRQADVIGKRIRLGSGISVEVVGIMGPEMASLEAGFQTGIEWWSPQSPKRSLRRGQVLDVVGRLAPGVSRSTAQAELNVIASNIATAFPDTNRDRGFRAIPLLETVVKNARTQLTFLFGAVLCVLLVTCVNVVHLFLANAAGRRVELATRAALGATRAHLVRQTLTESALLAVMGGAGGVLLATWAVPLLVSLAPEGIPRLHEIRLDWTTMGFAAALSLGVALLCGAAASLPLTMLKPWSALGRTRSGGSIQGRRVRHALAVCEIAVALVLVVASMLMLRTMRSFAALDLGFNPAGVVTAPLARPPVLPRDAAQLVRMHESEAAMVEEVRQLPGVVAAGIGGSPMGGSVGIQGVKLPNDTREFPMVGLTPVSVGYFEALGARLEAGRFFTAEDRAGAPTVAILSESAARTFWPSGNAVNALGQTFSLPANPDIHVVGIVADMAEFGLVTKGSGIFLPHVQSSYVTLPRMAIRTNGDPQQLVPAIKTIVRRANPEWPFPGVLALQDEIDRATAPRRFLLQLIGFFSLLGLSLAVIGIYGVLAESVAERIPEIGVRMALGAQRSDVMALFLRQGGAMLVTGLAIGLIAAFALRHEMTTLVFGVPTTDPISYAAACGALAAAAMCAVAIPARRATRLDPITALRTE